MTYRQIALRAYLRHVLLFCGVVLMIVFGVLDKEAIPPTCRSYSVLLYVVIVALVISQGLKILRWVRTYDTYLRRTRIQLLMQDEADGVQERPAAGTYTLLLLCTITLMNGPLLLGVIAWRNMTGVLPGTRLEDMAFMLPFYLACSLGYALMWQIDNLTDHRLITNPIMK